MRLLLALSFSALALPASAADYYTSAPVSDAMLFSGEGVLQREAVLNMPAGLHSVFLPKGQGEVLGVTAGDAEVLSVQTAFDEALDAARFDTETLSDLRKALQKAKEDLEDARQHVSSVQASLTTLQLQRALLETVAKAEPRAEAADVLIERMAFLAQQGQALVAQEQTQAEALRQAKDKRERAKTALETAQNALRNAGAYKLGQPLLRIDLRVPEDGAQSVSISQRFEGRWSPSYVARLDESAQSVSLMRRATVSQSSGLPWSAVTLSLGTGRIDLGVLPSFEGKNIARLFEAPMLLSRSMAAPAMMEADAFQGKDFGEERGAYVLPEPISIGATQQVFALGQADLSVTLRNEARPRQDEVAFLVAQADYEGTQPLMSGEVELFRGARFVGTMPLAYTVSGESLTLGFGPQEHIKLTRTVLVRETGDRGIISTNDTEEQRLQLSVENLGDSPETVYMRYAVPVSEQDDLRLRVQMLPQPTRRDIEQTLGLHEWGFTLAPNGMEKVDLSYQLSWPTGQRLDWRP